MDIELSLTGLPELEAQLREFAPRLVKRAFRKAAKAATAPQIAAAKRKAPVMAAGTPRRRPGELRDSIDAVIKVTKTGVRARVGPRRTKGGGSQDPGTWGLMEEFGSVHNRPQPYLRPAFDETRTEAVDQFAATLRAEVAEMGQKS